eukprot:6211863-Pleurochrysis_carterae.AAC.3
MNVSSEKADQCCRKQAHVCVEIKVDRVLAACICTHFVFLLLKYRLCKAKTLIRVSNAVVISRMRRQLMSVLLALNGIWSRYVIVTPINCLRAARYPFVCDPTVSPRSTLVAARAGMSS